LKEPWERYGIIISRYYWQENHRFEHKRPPMDPADPVFQRVWNWAEPTRDPNQRRVKYFGITLMVTSTGQFMFYPGPRPVEGICELYRALRDDRWGPALSHPEANYFLRKLELVYLEAEARVLADLEGSLPDEQTRIARVEIFQAGKYREMTADIFIDYSKNKGGEIVIAGHPQLSLMLADTITRPARTVASFFSMFGEVREYRDELQEFSRGVDRNLQIFATIADDHGQRLETLGRTQTHILKSIDQLSAQTDLTEFMTQQITLTEQMIQILQRNHEELLHNNDTNAEEIRGNLQEIQNEVAEQMRQTRAVISGVFTQLDEENYARFVATTNLIGRHAQELHDEFRVQMENARDQIVRDVMREVSLQIELDGSSRQVAVTNLVGHVFGEYRNHTDRVLVGLDDRVNQIETKIGTVHRHLSLELERVLEEIHAFDAKLDALPDTNPNFANAIQARARSKLHQINILLADRGSLPAKMISKLSDIPLSLTYYYLGRLDEMHALGKEKVEQTPQESAPLEGSTSDPDPTPDHHQSGLRRAIATVGRKVYHYFKRTKNRAGAPAIPSQALHGSRPESSSRGSPPDQLTGNPLEGAKGAPPGGTEHKEGGT
jgi:hypothetical protein